MPQSVKHFLNLKVMNHFKYRFSLMSTIDVERVGIKLDPSQKLLPSQLCVGNRIGVNSGFFLAEF